MEWISIKDKLPEAGVYVRTYRTDCNAQSDGYMLSEKEKENYKEVWEEYNFEGVWFDCPDWHSPTDKVTHWMPLPPNPII